MTPDLQGRRILVVEDEYLLASSLARALRAIGVVVVGPVPSVRAAMDLLSSEAPLDGAVLDVNLGSEKVYPVADALSARGVRYVFATGYSGPDLNAAYQDVPRCEKPVDVSALSSALA